MTWMYVKRCLYSKPAISGYYLLVDQLLAVRNKVKLGPQHGLPLILAFFSASLILTCSYQHSVYCKVPNRQEYFEVANKNCLNNTALFIARPFILQTYLTNNVIAVGPGGAFARVQCYTPCLAKVSIANWLANEIHLL